MNRPRPRKRHGATAGIAPILIALLVLLIHGNSVRSGLYLDDHAHYEQLRRGDWSFRSAVDASRLHIAGGVIDLWGRQEPPLVFFRPVAFWIMRAEYTLVGWSPAGMHLFSLLWHLLCCLLVGTLAMRCFGNRRWATAAAAIMAIHPAHVVTAQWIACQTELMATAFILLATLLYRRSARWPAPPLPIDRSDQADLAGKTSAIWQAHTPQPKPSTLTGAGVVLCFVMALGCRESVLLFPLVCWAGDALVNQRPWPNRRHILLLGILAAYLALRWWVLGGIPLPAKPYFVAPLDPDFPGYVLNKLGMYLTSLFFFIPLLPTGGQTSLADVNPVLCAGTAAIVGLLVLIWRAWRWQPALLWPVCWIACFLAPVLPVFPSSYHLYLPSVGAVLLILAGLAALGGRLPITERPSGTLRRAHETSGRSPSPEGQKQVASVLANTPVSMSRTTLRRWTCRVMTSALVVMVLAGTGLMAFIYRSVTRAEDILVDEVVRLGPPLGEGDHLFFINMPAPAAYAAPALRTRLGLSELTCHALTLSPDPLGMTQPGRIETIDGRSFVVHAPPNQRYLAGVDRVMLEGATAVKPRIESGELIDTGLFRVSCHSKDERGVRALRFEFHQALSDESPRFHLYLGSPEFMAYPIDDWVQSWRNPR